MKILDTSWTTLSLWAKGNKEEALAKMAGVSDFQTAAMKDGADIHAEIARKKLRLIPDINDSWIYENNEAEDRKNWINYFEVMATPYIKLRFVIDALSIENKTILDWKTGKRKSYEQNKMQIYIYALGVELAGLGEIDKGIFAKVVKDYETEAIYCNDYAVFKINEEKKELARNYIETIGGEIYTFLKLDK